MTDYERIPGYERVEGPAVPGAGPIIGVYTLGRDIIAIRSPDGVSAGIPWVSRGIGEPWERLTIQ